ncbi:hypothetical protein B0H12DRAFT_1267750, partial [Mycena haematopus]
SIRTKHIHRLTRNFLWKCMHNTYHVGQFWDRVPNLEIFGECSTCRVTESMEHILLECEAPGQRQVWKLTESIWRLRYMDWPNLNWGLLLGCGLSRFQSGKGNNIHAKNRFFAIIVSVSMKLIWNLRNERLFQAHCFHSEQGIHNRWISAINAALKQDRLLTSKARFGDLAIKKQLMLNTWSGTLLDEDSLPDDWTKIKGVLVGIRPISRKNGVG